MNLATDRPSTPAAWHVDVVCFTGLSGLTDYSVSLCRALAARATPGSRVQLVSAESVPQRFRQLGFDVRTPFRRSRHYALDVPRFFMRTRRERPTAVLFQSPLKFPLLEAIGIAWLRRAGIRVALTIHDVLPHYPRWWSRWEYRLYYRCFDHLIVHSELAASTLAELGVAKRPLVVPHGIYDLFRLSSPTRRQAREHVGGLAPEDRVVLFFGHLEPRKGLLELLEVARRMASVPQLKFLIAGSNDLAAHGQQAVEALEAARGLPNVLLHDRRIPFEEVEHYFLASDLVALPYREGSTSGVLKLALAFGLPVVATRIGDIPAELPRGAGILFDGGPALVDGLQQAIGQALEGDLAQAALAMQHAAREKGWAPIAAAYLQHLTG